MKVTIYGDKQARECGTGEVAEAGNLDDLIRLFEKNTWAPGIFEPNLRKRQHFREASVIAIDVDGGWPLSEALPQFKSYQCIVYTTKSHQKEKGGRPPEDRYRVVFPLSRPIKHELEWKLTFKKLIAMFPKIDRACSDCSRLFYKGQPHLIQRTGELLKTESMLSRLTNLFLETGEMPDRPWNNALYVAAKDIQEQLLPEEDAIDILEQAARVEVGNFGYLDEADLRTISSAYSTPPTNPPRAVAPIEYDEKGNVKGIDIGEISKEVIEHQFLLHVTPEKTQIYMVSDPVHREVVRVANPDLILRTVTNNLEIFKGVPELPTAQNLIKHWRLSAPSLTEMPSPFAWKYDANWTLKRFNFDLAPGDRHPAWDEFLGRLSDKDAFMAYLWSAFEMANESRQTLWLYGPAGLDGKTTVLNIIKELFGEAAAGINNAQVSSKSRFLLSNMFNRRVAIYPDCKNLRFPMSELFRTMTSGDVVPIEFKNEGFVNIPMYLKLFIASNEMPYVSSDTADLSRLLVVEVNQVTKRKTDPEWKKKLRAELPAFLASCKEAYQNLCPDHGDIAMSETSIALRDQSSEDLTEGYRYVIEDAFEICNEEDGPGLPAQELYNWFNRLNKPNLNYRDLKRFLLSSLGVKRRRLSAGDNRGYYYPGLKFKENQTTSLQMFRAKIKQQIQD